MDHWSPPASLAAAGDPRLDVPGQRIRHGGCSGRTGRADARGRIRSRLRCRIERGEHDPPLAPPGACRTGRRSRLLPNTGQVAGCPVRAHGKGQFQRLTEANLSEAARNPLRAQIGMANLSGAPPGLKSGTPDPVAAGSSVTIPYLADGHNLDSISRIQCQQRRPILSLRFGA